MTSLIKNYPSQVDQYLSHARAFAQEILSPTPIESSVNLHSAPYVPYYTTPRYFRDDSPSLWNYWFPVQHRHEVHHYHHAEKTDAANEKYKKKKEQAVAGAAALAIGAVALGALYITAAEAGKFYSIRSDIQKLDREEYYIQKDFATNLTNSSTLTQVECIMDIHRDILNECYQSSMHYLMAKGLVTSGLSVGVAALAQTYFTGEMDHNMSTMALAATAIGIIGWVMKAGFDSTDTSVHKKAQELFQAVKNIRI